jgi:hypothetical protein
MAQEWGYECTPPIIVGESEWLRKVWRRLALPVRDSHHCERVRMAPRGVAVTGTTDARLPSLRAGLNDSVRCGGD